MGVGAILIFFGVALLAARIARPLAGVLGIPSRRLGGVAGRLAQENAQRNPQRTASTASALMIGLALVTLVATLAAGITSTFTNAVEDLWSGADYAITAQNNFSPLPASVADAVEESPGVEAVGNVRTGEAQAFGDTFFATAVEPGGRVDVQRRLEGGVERGARLARRRTARSSTRTTPTTTTCASARRSSSPSRTARRSSSRSRACSSRRPAARRSATSRSRRRPGTSTTRSRATSTRSCAREGGQTDANVAALEQTLDRVPEREGCDAGASSSTTRSRG